MDITLSGDGNKRLLVLTMATTIPGRKSCPMLPFPDFHKIYLLIHTYVISNCKHRCHANTVSF